MEHNWIVNSRLDTQDGPSVSEHCDICGLRKFKSYWERIMYSLELVPWRYAFKEEFLMEDF
jgi:hypothetical protein